MCLGGYPNNFLARAIDLISQQVLEKTQSALGVTKESWEAGTSQGVRQCHFSGNHYRLSKGSGEMAVYRPDYQPCLEECFDTVYAPLERE